MSMSSFETPLHEFLREALNPAITQDNHICMGLDCPLCQPAPTVVKDIPNKEEWFMRGIKIIKAVTYSYPPKLKGIVSWKKLKCDRYAITYWRKKWRKTLACRGSITLQPRFASIWFWNTLPSTFWWKSELLAVDVSTHFPLIRGPRQGQSRVQAPSRTRGLFYWTSRTNLKDAHFSSKKPLMCFILSFCI